MPRDQAIATAEKYLDKVGLREKRDEYPARLSGGQKQRVAIARALTMEPKVLLFDEPTSALDPSLVGEVITVMEELAHEGATMIVVTHEMAFAREAADRVYFIQEGAFVEAGPPEQVLDAPKDPRTQTFLARFLEGENRWDRACSARIGLLVDLEHGAAEAGQPHDDHEHARRMVGAELVERTRAEQPEQAEHEAEEPQPEDDEVGRQPVDLERALTREPERHQGEDRHRRQEHQDAGRLECVAGRRREPVGDDDRPPRQDAAEQQDEREHGSHRAAAAEGSTMHRAVRYAPAP